MDEKGFLLGISNQAKVIVRRGRVPPRETENGSREWITVVEACCANTMLPPMVTYQGKGLYLVGLMQTTIVQTKLHQIEHQGSLARIWHMPFQSRHCLTALLRKLGKKQSDGRHSWCPQGCTRTALKLLAWKTPQNRRQLRHQSNAAIRILSNSGGPESDSMIQPPAKSIRDSPPPRGPSVAQQPHLPRKQALAQQPAHELNPELITEFLRWSKYNI